MRFEEIKMNEAMKIDGGMIGPVIPQKVIVYLVGKVANWLANR